VGNSIITVYGWRFYVTERAVKEIIHEFEPEALPRVLMSSPCPFQGTSGLILSSASLKVIKLTILNLIAQDHPSMSRQVVTFDTDDKVCAG